MAAAAGSTASLSSTANAFGARVFASVAPAAPDDSEGLFISPYSLHAALSIASVGAAGATQLELRKLLGYGADLGNGAIGSSWRELNARLADVRGPTVLVANSVWTKSRFAEAFEATALEDFAASVGPLDSAARINDWVRDRTRGMIDTMVSDDLVRDPLTRAILVNALYFKGRCAARARRPRALDPHAPPPRSWETSFARGATRPQAFHLSPGLSLQVHMMSAVRQMAAARRARFVECWLPYKVEAGSTPAAGVIVLPDPGVSVAAALGEWAAGDRLRPPAATSTALSLPRFKCAAAMDVAGQLRELGAPTCTSDDADFSPMLAAGGRDLYISNVLHRCVVEVDEEGTEAAAATAVVMKTRARVASPLSVVCDRPFGFAVVVGKSATILFMGEVRRPTRAS